MEKTYQLVIRIQFPQVDDVGARMELTGIKNNIQLYLERKTTEIKLQEIFPNKSPRGLSL